MTVWWTKAEDRGLLFVVNIADGLLAGYSLLDQERASTWRTSGREYWSGRMKDEK